MCDAFTLFVLQCLGDRKIIFLITIGAEIVMPVIPLFADLCLRPALPALDTSPWRRLRFFELRLTDDHVAPGLDLVALLDLFRRHFFARIGIDHMLLRAFLGSIVEHVKADRAILYGGI